MKLLLCIVALVYCKLLFGISCVCYATPLDKCASLDRYQFRR